MSNNNKSFHDKWFNNTLLFFAETLQSGSDTQRWILERNGFSSSDEFSSYLSDRRRILDAGCGNGRVTALLRLLAPSETEIVGIDLVAADVARENFKNVPRTYFETRDLTSDLSSLGQFDFIYCQEVLHHTADPVRSFNNLRELLAPNGELAIYVYKKKAPAREFVDDYVRDQIAGLTYDEAMVHSAQITDFGRALTEANLKVKVPQVDVLGIEAGEYDVQRLLYHFFAKCYWNSGVSYEENILVNYDWYHPQVATRHTLQEVETWFEGAGLKIEHRCVDFYGITLRGRNV
jgi:SAM-dependent methyltransferase